MKSVILNRIALFLLLAAPLAISCNERPIPREPVIVSKTTEKTPNGTIVVNAKPSPSPFDQSPLDIIYFPVDFPKLKSQQNVSATPKIRILYSRPQRHGRVIFGQLEKYGQPWRMGANEATEIELFTNVSINGKKLPKGRYIIYCIPYEDKWTVIFNSNLYTWGLEFDKAKDVLQINTPVIPLPEPTEVLTMQFTSEKQKALLSIEWDTVKTVIPFTFE